MRAIIGYAPCATWCWACRNSSWFKIVPGVTLWPEKSRPGGQKERKAESNTHPAGVTPARASHQKRNAFKKKRRRSDRPGKTICVSYGRNGTLCHLRCKNYGQIRNRNCRGQAMKVPKSPPDRRKFAGAWDEISYLYH